MIKARKIIRYALAALSITLLAAFSVSCVSAKDSNGGGDDYNPHVSVIEQPKSSDLNVYVNKTDNASFSIPVIVDTFIYLNSNTAKSNDKIYVTDIAGENIDDLSVAGLPYIFFAEDAGIIDAAQRNFVCVFNFDVSPKATWVSKGVVRKITQITFKIFDAAISVPVAVNIFEKEDNSKFIYECPILKNTQYLTLSNRVLRHMNKPLFTLALNWNIQGWDGSDCEDDRYATIVGFRFANSALRLERFAVIVNNDEGVPIEEISVPINLSDVNYDLTSRQCFWSGNFVEFEASIVDEGNQIVSDSLIMQYTLNGESRVYEVVLATVQLYDYDALLFRLPRDS
ncbi:MAG: hypothetical protein LBP62_00175 [Clostridiales bacterium]|jgi:hypothetical protein|nr:hypothetical protein [Clostridiales bacterium]